MSKHKRKKRFPEILLVISALFLGALIVILVYQTRNKATYTGAEGGANRNLSGSFPLPSELVESDKITYFAYTEVPDIIFRKMEGVSYKDDCPVSREDLRYLKVLYWGTDGKPHQGEMIVNLAIAPDLVNVFYDLYKASYPIQNIELIDTYGGNDEVSMANNNTSCFNTRKVQGTDEWSLHAYGLAVDLNPLYNPYVGSDGTVLPVAASPYADRDNNFVMKINTDDYAYTVFQKYGFTWGGSWESVKDYQHFEKNPYE